MNVTNATDIPTPGTPAYWTAQREAVALVDAYAFSDPDPFVELESLRRIAAHGFAARIMAAHRKPVASWIRDLERIVAAIDAPCDDDADPDGPPHGQDWCKRGCQILYGMNCGMCGYDGPGVWIDQLDVVAECCCHCKARTYQSQEGICTLCGKDAETPDAPAPQAALCFWGCQTVSTDTQCTLCRGLECHARGAAAEAGIACRTGPDHGTPKTTILDGGP